MNADGFAKIRAYTIDVGKGGIENVSRLRGKFICYYTHVQRAWVKIIDTSVSRPKMAALITC